MLTLIATRQIQIIGSGRPRLLHEPVKQHHPSFPIGIKEHAGGPVVAQSRSHFIDSVAERLADRHPYRPTELDGRYVPANPFPVVSR